MCSHFHKVHLGVTKSSGPGLIYEVLGNNVDTWKLRHAIKALHNEDIDLQAGEGLGDWRKIK